MFTLKVTGEWRDRAATPCAGAALADAVDLGL